MPGKLTAQALATGDALVDALAALARDRERWRAAARRAAREALVALARADAALGAAAAETGEYLAAADAPAGRRGRLERFLRALFFLEQPAPAAGRRFRRVRYLCTDVVVALAGILVSAGGFGLTVQEPDLYGAPVLLLFGLAIVPFVLLGVTALAALSHELSERRTAPRKVRSKSAMKKRLRALRPRRRAA